MRMVRLSPVASGAPQSAVWSAAVADYGECAVELVHHSQKAARQPGADPGIAQARGASALIDGARSARYLTAMTKEEAHFAGLDGPNGYFQVTTGKANLAPTGKGSRWFRMVGLGMGNGDDEYPDGDHVGVVERWSMPDTFEGVSAEDLSKVQAVIAVGEWRKAPTATDWAGYAVADALGLDVGKKGKAGNCTSDQKGARKRVGLMLSTWVTNEVLVEVEGWDKKARRNTTFIQVPEDYHSDTDGELMDDLATHEGGEA